MVYKKEGAAANIYESKKGHVITILPGTEKSIQYTEEFDSTEWEEGEDDDWNVHWTDIRNMITASMI